MRLPRLPTIPVVPTQRTAWIAAAAAPIALVIAASAQQAWIVAPAAALALLLVVVLDGLLAGRLAEWELAAPADTEVGEPTSLTLRCRFASGMPTRVDGAIEFDPRLGEGGRAVIALRPDPTGASFRGIHQASPPAGALQR